VLRRLDKSILAAFGRVRANKVAQTRNAKEIKPGFPRFKSKNRYKSFTYPQSGFKVEGSSLVLSKIGAIRVFKHREIEGKVKTCTLKRDSTGCWYAILIAEIPDVPEREPNSNIFVIGIDLGTRRQKDPATGNVVARLATLSNGQEILYPRFFVETEDKLKAYQQVLSRKKRGSKNREKARVKLAKIHKKIRNQRDDFLHKKTRKLVNLADLIVFERLQIYGLSRAINRAKDMHDHALRKFVQFTTYKAERAGGSVEFVNPRGTTKRCSICGLSIKMKSGDIIHHCPECGLSLSRDHVAAINILYRGVDFKGISLRAEDYIYTKEDGTLGLRDRACIDLVDYYRLAGSL
jgi:putative transposase